jgi:uncharacterized protein YdeI (YjbR/CyaY-like superfamily)
MPEKQIETFSPTSPQAWRKWLTQNHDSKQAVWLLLYKKEANQPTIAWNEAVDQALCFGWIDSKRKPLDDEKFLQFFSKRKPRGTWSKVNKEKVLQLAEAGLMTKAGLDCIEKAKQNGSWAILDEVEELKIPEDLEEDLVRKPGAMDFYLSLSKSVRKSILLWLVLAKRAETRQSRIKEIAELASQKLKPKHLR